MSLPYSSALRATLVAASLGLMAASAHAGPRSMP